MVTTAIVTRPRGSWRWQDAYGISRYKAHWTRDGRLIWRCTSSHGKYSLPQLRRLGYDTSRIGGLHNKPITASEVKAY